MLKGRSKSFAPKSVPRAPKRKAPDDATEPPAKRISATPDQPPASTPEVQHIATPAPESIPTVEATNPVTEDVTSNSAPARESSPRPDARPESQLATQDVPMVESSAVDNAPARDTAPIVNTAPEIRTTTPAAITNEATPEPPRIASEPAIREEPVLPSIETNDRQRSRSLALVCHVLPEQPRYRYPSPQNIAHVVESGAAGANMGPPGGQLGAAGNVTGIDRSGEIVQMAVLNPDGTTGKIVEEPASGTEKGKKKKKGVSASRRKKVQGAEDDGDDTRATIDMGFAKARRQAAKKATKKKKQQLGRKVREATPSDAEEEIIDPTTMTMTDLCKDLRIGKKFSLHDVIKQRVLQKKQERQKKVLPAPAPEANRSPNAEDGNDEANRPGAAGPSGTNAGTVTTDGDQPTIQKEATAAPAGVGAEGPQLRIVDGNIVLDEQSLVVDRQRQAAAARAEMEEVEENDFSKTFTSASFMKREKIMQWDAVATDMFYKGLSRYGTDFETIAKLFPHRSRRHIKLKFNAEEKRNPAKITRYLTQPKKAIDLDHFERMSGVKLESVEAIEAEQAREAAEHEASLAKVLEDMAAADRAKKAEIAKTSAKRAAAKRILEGTGDSDDEELARGTGESSKENAAPGAASTSATGKGKKKAPRKRAAKNKHSHIPAEEEIILGSIE